MTEPKVSIICRTYNQQNLIGKTIESVLNQTFTDWELIVIDDLSTDSTYNEILKFKDPRIKPLRNTRNLGPLANINTGIQLARGKYIAMLDGDDEALPSKLERQVDFLDNNPDYGAVLHYINIIDGQSRPNETPHAAFLKNLINNPSGTRPQMLKKMWDIYNFFAFSTDMFRKEQAIYFHEHLLACGDAFSHLSILLKTKIKVLEEALVNYRVISKEENVSFFCKENSSRSEKQFILDKFLEIKDIVLFKDIFGEDALKYGALTQQSIPFILSMIAQNSEEEEKQFWGNLNFHKFISNNDNLAFMYDVNKFTFRDLLSFKNGPDRLPMTRLPAADLEKLDKKLIKYRNIFRYLLGVLALFIIYFIILLCR